MKLQQFRVIDSALIGELQLILAERRTSLAMMRTGISVIDIV